MENLIQIYIGTFPDENTRNMYVGSHIIEPNEEIDEMEEVENPKYWSRMAQEVGMWIDPSGYYFAGISGAPILISELCDNHLKDDVNFSKIRELFSGYIKKNGKVYANTIIVFYGCNEDFVGNSGELKSYDSKYIGYIEE